MVHTQLFSPSARVEILVTTQDVQIVTSQCCTHARMNRIITINSIRVYYFTKPLCFIWLKENIYAGAQVSTVCYTKW